MAAGASTTNYQQPNLNGTGFTNLQSILGANSGNQLNNTISGDITQAGQQAQGNLNSSFNNFNTAVNQGNLSNPTNQALVNSTINGITSPTDNNANDYNNFSLNPGTTTSTNGTTTTTTNPFYNTQTQQDFGNFLGGQYSGPTSISNLGQIQTGLNNAQSLGQAAQTQAGRMGLLQNFSNNPQYTTGEQNLDTLFLGGPKLAQAAQSTSGLSSLGANAAIEAQNSVNNAKASSQQFGQDTAAALGNYNASANTGTGALGQIGQGIASNVGTLGQNYTTALQGIQALNPAGQANGPIQINAQTEQLTGLSPGTNLYGVNPASSQFYTPEQAPAFNNAQTPEQVAQMQALNQLAGNPSSSVSNLNQMTYNPTTPYNFNLGAFQNAQQNAQNAYNTAYNTAVNPYTASTPTGLGSIGTAAGELNALQQQEQSPTGLAGLGMTQAQYNTAIAPLLAALQSVQNNPQYGANEILKGPNAIPSQGTINGTTGTGNQVA